MNIVNKSKGRFTKKALEELVKKQDFKFGFFDMYYNGGATGCFASKEVVAVIMHESSWSDARGGGGIERKSGIRIFNEELEQVGEGLWLKEYRHRSDGRYDDYSLELKEIISVEVDEKYVTVKCKTGTDSVRKVIVLKEKSKEGKAEQ